MAGLSGAPRTRYASCGETDIAYQVFGDGPIDLLVLPGPLIPIDTIDGEKIKPPADKTFADALLRKLSGPDAEVLAMAYTKEFDPKLQGDEVKNSPTPSQ